jgi:hypothetical protein
MLEYQVPTLQLAANVWCADGRGLAGSIFVPACSSVHGGPMRPEEWINQPHPFFPFAADGSDERMVLNKAEVVALTVAADDESGADDEAGDIPVCRVAIEIHGRRFAGMLVIDMPPNQQRVVDFLNRPDAFLTLRDGGHHHLIQKARITRVVECLET